MGVMSCCRNNCENIMCDIYVDDIGYICHDCQSEFTDKLTSKEGRSDLPKSYIMEKLKEFMESSKGFSDNTIVEISDIFKR